MKRALRIGLVVVLLLLAAGGAVLWRSLPSVPDRPFATPSGAFAVGTREFHWIDSTRGEPYTTAADDRRHVAVQVWYPAAPGVAGDPAHWLLQRDAFGDRLGRWVARNARTNSVLDAAVADGGPFPVLVYHHGGLWTRWSATFTTEWLASHGYVVFSVEHFGFNQMTKYPDGTPFRPDTLALPGETGNGREDALRSWAFLDGTVFPIWKADAAFVLDRVEGLNADPGPLQGRLDLDRVGMFGWSFGGALAVQMSRDDPRVKAAVDHDGQLFGDVRELGTTRPVMLFHHGIDDALAYPEEDRTAIRELIAMVAGWDSTARVRSSSDWYEVSIARTDHGDFSDLSLVVPRPKERLDARRAHAIINAYTLAFFDRYLKGTETALLSAGAQPDAEVTFRSWPAPKDSAPPE